MNPIQNFAGYLFKKMNPQRTEVDRPKDHVSTVDKFRIAEELLTDLNNHEHIEEAKRILHNETGHFKINFVISWINGLPIEQKEKSQEIEKIIGTLLDDNIDLLAEMVNTLHHPILAWLQCRLAILWLKQMQPELALTWMRRELFNKTGAHTHDPLLQRCMQLTFLQIAYAMKEKILSTECLMSATGHHPSSQLRSFCAQILKDQNHAFHTLCKEEKFEEALNEIQKLIDGKGVKLL